MMIFQTLMNVLLIRVSAVNPAQIQLDPSCAPAIVDILYLMMGQHV
jgi:hypothetical protein